MKILFYLALLLTAFTMVGSALAENWVQVIFGVATLVVLFVWCRPNS
jgi:hypothetical protein